MTLREAPIRTAALLCRRAGALPGRWRLVRRLLPAVRQHGGAMAPTTVTTRHGFRVRCELDDWIGQYLFVTGTYEERTTELMSRLVRPGATVVDVGANVGFYSLLLSRLVGSSGRVIAFEPMPVALERLRHNLILNGVSNVDVRGVAVGDRETEATLFLGPATHTSISSLDYREGAPRVTVACVTLDTALAGAGPVELLKIDTEGAEPRVLAGAGRILDEGVRYMITEVSDVGWVRMLTDRGYDMYAIGWDGLMRVSDPAGPQLPDQFNALFTREPLPTDLTVREQD